MNNWKTVKLGDVLEKLESGKRPKGGVKNITSGIPSIGGEHLSNDGLFDFTNVRYVPEDFAETMNKGWIKQEDIIVVKDGATTAKTSFVTKNFPFRKAVINEHVFICRVKKEINPKWVFFNLWSEQGRKKILLDFRGAAQGGISSNFINKVEIPLPPLPEQKKIVEKIEELFSGLDSGVASLKKAKEQIRLYRQSVLAAAFSGKLLTPSAGRKAHSEMLKAAEPKVDYSNQLPHGWKWVKLGSLAEIKRGKSKHRPRNAPKLYGGKYPFIQTGEIREANGGTINTFRQTYNEIGLAQSKLWPKGTLCISIAANIGETAFLGFDSCFPDSIVGIIPNKEVLQGKFVNYFFMKEKERISELAPATAQKNINVDILQKLDVPLPPLNQQHQIVAEIEKRFSEADNLEKAIDDSLAKSEILRQSILSRAFSGKLV